MGTLHLLLHGEPLMPGNLEPYFWDNLVLQFSHREPTIRYSLIALSAMYEELENRRQDGTRLGGKGKSVYVLQQYTKALNCVRSSLSTGQADTRGVLMSCLVFVWIEVLGRDLDAGFKHLESGLRIIRDLRKGAPNDRKLDSSERDVEDIYGSLERSFKRLSTQAMIHGRVSSRPGPGLRTHPWKSEQPIPDEFEDLSEARSWLDGIWNSTAVCVREIRDSAKYGTVDHAPDLLLIDSACEALLRRVEDWHRATQKMLASLKDIEKHTRAIAHLDLYHTYVTLTLRMPFARSEMVFDRHAAEFAKITDLADQLLTTSTSDEPPILSFDLGVLPPLFFLLLKCRDIEVRRRALVLLKHAPEQEGFWRRAGLAAYAEWKIEYEERGRGELPESSPLPEAARIYQERLVFHFRNGERVPMLSFRRSSVSLLEPP